MYKIRVKVPPPEMLVDQDDQDEEDVGGDAQQSDGAEDDGADGVLLMQDNITPCTTRAPMCSLPGCRPSPAGRRPPRRRRRLRDPRNSPWPR